MLAIVAPAWFFSLQPFVEIFLKGQNEKTESSLMELESSILEANALPETNSSPLKIGHLKKETTVYSIPIIHFQVRLLLVSGRVKRKLSQLQPTWLLCIGLEAFRGVGLPNLIIFIGDQVGCPRAEFLEGSSMFPSDK